MAVGLSVLLMAGVVVWLLVTQLGCGPAETADKPKEGFASDRVAPAPFDAKRAMGYLEALCKIGPRISGSDGMKKQQELLTKHFEDLGGKVTRQEFTATQRSDPKKEVAMCNLIVSWKPDLPRRVVLCSHYDTRPLADQEKERSRWTEAFLSANDGGSGVALLMELAHAMKDLDTKVGVDFVFFDGEEYVFDEKDKYFFGSEYFGREARKNKKKTQYVAAVLMDMIGGKDAKFPVEQNSLWKAGPLVEDLWRTAEEQQCPAFRRKELSRVAVLDDHMALNESGIPAIDIVDFDYPHWHKLTDTPENCSGDALEQVARVLSVWVQRVK
jgi:hypothetical protein